jgi:hypothetical protein|tara:strand:- start:262 stop:435 length:174 start_codon:yes stop_codon:yes gene_type:complete
MSIKSNTIEELCVALERTGALARELMFTALLKDSAINEQLDLNTETINQAINLVNKE